MFYFPTVLKKLLPEGGAKEVNKRLQVITTASILEFHEPVEPNTHTKRTKVAPGPYKGLSTSVVPVGHSRLVVGGDASVERIWRKFERKCVYVDRYCCYGTF